MTQATCQRCGASGDVNNAVEVLSLKHEPGCAPKIGPLKYEVAKPTFKKVEGKSTEPVVLDEAKTEKPKAKKTSKRKKSAKAE